MYVIIFSLNKKIFNAEVQIIFLNKKDANILLFQVCYETSQNV